MQLILIVLFSSLVSCLASFSSDSSYFKSPSQKCMTSDNFQFYCSSDEKCYDGNLRCSSNSFLSWLSYWFGLRCPQENQACYEASDGNGYYTIHLYAKPLVGNDNRPPFEHHVVQYRGFIYEFGNYAPNTLRILDTHDPEYIYQNVSKDLFRPIGKSNCTAAQVNQHTTFWRQNYNRYNVCTNNCQGYAKSLLKWLQGDCNGEPRM